MMATSGLEIAYLGQARKSFGGGDEMARSRLLKSFRVRLLLLLAALLILTLSVQYLVNLQSVRANRQLIIAQQQAIMAGGALGGNSLPGPVYLHQMREQARPPLLGEPAQRAKDLV